MAVGEWIPTGPLTAGMRILTNFERFPAQWTSDSGVTAVIKSARTSDEFIRQLGDFDVFLVNSDLNLLYRLCLHLRLPRWRQKRLIAVDLVLGRPKGIKAEIRSWVVKQLFSRVDWFINYFKYSEGYEKIYGITPRRSKFVHFKPNLRHRLEVRHNPDGDYILCFGRSRRDYDTFFRAVARLPYPAAIPAPDFVQLKRHGSRFTVPLDQLPPQVKLLPDDGSQDTMVRIISEAKVVVLPLIPDNLLAGISVYLDAMLLGKCVIMTEGAGSSDVLTKEALFVRPGDDIALSNAIRSVWENDQLRNDTARYGYEHALSLGGEPELYQRILAALAEDNPGR